MFIATLKRPETGSELKLEFNTDPMFEMGFALMMVTDYHDWELQNVSEVV